MKSKPETITLIFDYDGTLHDSIRIYAPAFRKGYSELVRQERLPEQQFSDAEISRWLGYSVQEMWQLFMPELPQKTKEACSRMIGDEMVRLTKEGKAVLYPGALETLEQLKADYRLILLSNCKQSYLEAHRCFFNLNRYFDVCHCAEDYHFMPKWKILQTILKNSGWNKALVIGDRLQDMEAARLNSLPAVGCAYGYGNQRELTGAARIADSCSGLYSVIEQVTAQMY